MRLSVSNINDFMIKPMSIHRGTCSLVLKQLLIISYPEQMYIYNHINGNTNRHYPMTSEHWALRHLERLWLFEKLPGFKWMFLLWRQKHELECTWVVLVSFWLVSLFICYHDMKTTFSFNNKIMSKTCNIRRIANEWMNANEFFIIIIIIIIRLWAELTLSRVSPLLVF